VLHGPLKLQPHGEEVVIVADPDGYEYCFVDARVRHRHPEAGVWSMAHRVIQEQEDSSRAVLSVTWSLSGAGSRATGTVWTCGMPRTAGGWTGSTAPSSRRRPGAGPRPSWKWPRWVRPGMSRPLERIYDAETAQASVVARWCGNRVGE
jgi:hypothetical protein